MRELQLLVLITILDARLGLTQEVLQIRWPAADTAGPVSFSGIQADLLPAFRLGISVLPEEAIISGSLWQGQLLGLPANDSRRINDLFANYYARLRQVDAFRTAPSALPYCFSDRKPSEGLATVYIPARVTANTKSIVFLHGYGGSLAAYLYFLSNVFSNHVIICPAYGISCANIQFSYLAGAQKAVSSRLEKEIRAPLLIGLSAGGFGACRVYSQKPEAFRGLICIAAYPPADVSQRFTSKMRVRFVAGNKEPYVTNGSFRQQMFALKAKVESLDWKLIEGADHFFLLSHEGQTKNALLEWESP